MKSVAAAKIFYVIVAEIRGVVLMLVKVQGTTIINCSDELPVTVG